MIGYDIDDELDEHDDHDDADDGHIESRRSAGGQMFQKTPPSGRSDDYVRETRPERKTRSRYAVTRIDARWQRRRSGASATC